EWDTAARRVHVGEGPLGGQIQWLVSDSHGRVVDRSAPDVDEEILSEASAAFTSRTAAARRITWQGRQWQILQRELRAATAMPVSSGKPAEADAKEIRYPMLLVTVAMPLQPARSALLTLALTLGGLSAAIMLASLIGGRHVCRRALSPLIRMATAVREINAGDLSARLPGLTANDELNDLSDSFDGLLNRLEESFARQQRFTGDASHQLRTPLTAMLGQLDVALRRQRSAEEYQEVLATVRARAQHMGQIVEALLFLARAEAEARLPELERLDLAEWLPKYMKTWSESARAADIRLEIISKGSCFVKAQPAMLAELFGNLLDNAIKYSRAGTAITVNLQERNQEAALSFEDRGCGIAAEDLPNLFQPFFRSSEARGRGIPGVGLGLAIADRLVKAIGGRIMPGIGESGGSRFTVYLPIE
ncbi:MAG: sensor histidine kinase, partial [Candidatus Acidiferrum sp.]